MGTYKFRKLKVWQKSVEFITFIYRATADFPKDERFGLVDQIRRAATSICLNIAEGSGCGSDAEFIRFLRMAQRSAFEVVAALEISGNLKFGDKENLIKATEYVNELSAMITGLIKSLKTKS